MPKRICVVGAGPAGLVSTTTLALAGLEVDCLEMSTETGGHWVIDNPNGRSAAYGSLETNTTRRMSRECRTLKEIEERVAERDR